MFQQSIGQNKTKEEQQFLDLETQWMNAWENKDEVAARRIMSDDFALTSTMTTGELTYKETWIQHAMHGFDCQSFGFDSIKVRIYGNTAVLNVWYHQVATINGKEWSGNALLTDVWVRKNDDWQVVARHATSLSKK
jgi:ketosteroid isomerase-like protein